MTWLHLSPYTKSSLRLSNNLPATNGPKWANYLLCIYIKHGSMAKCNKIKPLWSHSTIQLQTLIPRAPKPMKTPGCRDILQKNNMTCCWSRLSVFMLSSVHIQSPRPPKKGQARPHLRSCWALWISKDARSWEESLRDCAWVFDYMIDYWLLVVKCC